MFVTATDFPGLLPVAARCEWVNQGQKELTEQTEGGVSQAQMFSHLQLHIRID